MRLPRSATNKLLVEGDDEKRAIPFLMDAHIRWGDNRDEWPVEIIPYNGFQNLVAPGEIETQLKSSGLQSIGILVDANDSALARWTRVRSRCIALFPGIPMEPNQQGVIVENGDGMRFGAWLMPDNRLSGMLESFLAYLVPSASRPLWDHASNWVESARKLNAPVKAAHIDKARMHAWLSIQDPPGLQLHVALLAKVLDAGHTSAQDFVRWFTDLYQIHDLIRDNGG